MSNTPAVQYTNLLAGAVEATGGRTTGWLKRFYDPGQFISNATGVGSVQIPKPSAFTVQTPTDGTLQTNQYANTYTTCTFRDRTVPINVPPSTKNQWDFATPGNLEQVAKMSADALLKDAAGQVIADLVALAPGKTTALATGKIDFVAATSTEIGVLMATISYIEAHAGGCDVFQVFEPVAWGNFATAVAALSPGAIFMQRTNLGTGTDLFYNGYPVYITGATATAWGGANNACCYVLHQNSYAFASTGAYPHDPDRFWMPLGTGWYSHLDNITTLRSASGMHLGLIGEVTNPAS